jgi:hypothetical protein
MCVVTSRDQICMPVAGRSVIKPVREVYYTLTMAYVSVVWTAAMSFRKTRDLRSPSPSRPRSVIGMSAGTAGDADTLALRQTGTLLVPGAVWLFCALGLGDALVEGTAGYVLKTALLMVAIAFAAWLFLASPCLLVAEDGLRVVNPLRVHWIPFGALETVEVSGLTTVAARRASGRLTVVTSWNGPGVSQKFADSTSPVTQMIERYRDAWRAVDAGAPAARAVVVSWRWQPTLILMGLLAANTIIWLR